MRAPRTRTLPLAVFLAVGVVFAAMSTGSWVLYDRTEQRLLQQRMELAANVLQLNLVNVETPLVGAAQVAAATSGDPEPFSRAVEPFVGAERMFAAVAVYRVSDAHLLHVVGDTVEVPQEGADGLPRVLGRAVEVARSGISRVAVVDLLDVGAGRRLGYAAADETGTFVVYGQRLLHPDPYLRQRNEEAFSRLDYAVYLGDSPDGALIGASRPDLPLPGRTASVVLPLGDRQRLLVVTPIGHLSGELFVHLWWIVASVGLVVATGFATMARRLERQRDRGFALAADNARLYDGQRQIAEILQVSLLPQQLDIPAGTEVAARYWPAGAANLIGGDFYDVFRIDEVRWGLMIGDVCGKGIAAATLTGLSRHTARAAARHARQPSDVLRALHVALADHQPPTFCTAVFAFMCVEPTGERRLTVSLAGHPPPLLRHGDGSVEEVGEAGTLLGMVEPLLVDVEVDVASGDLLLLYTDGLTDAPGEEAVPIEEVVGLLAARGGMPVEPLADELRVLKRRHRPRGSGDDTAVLVVRL